MNLQGRVISGLLFLVALSFFGCEDPSEVGLELNPNENNVGVYEREFILPSSVVLNDSINTSNDTRLLVGRFDDPVFGKVTAKSFTQVTREGEFAAIDTKGVLDSIVFNLEVSYAHGQYGFFYQTLNIYQLSDTLFSSLNYFADDETTYSGKTEVASKRWVYSPTNDTVIRLKAEPFWAASIFNKVLDGTTPAELKNDIKGFALVPGDENTFVFGFNPTNSFINFHYHTESRDSLEYKLSFALNGLNDMRYNHISVDRTGTELETLSGDVTEFVPPSGYVYAQAGTGVHTKISLAPVRQFLDSLQNVMINRAELTIGPNAPLTSPDYYIKPPSAIGFVRGREEGNHFWVFAGAFSTTPNYVVMTDQGYIGKSPVLKSTPAYDSASRSYKAIPTLFFQHLKDNIEFDDLVIYPMDKTSLNRYIIPADSIRLKIFYTNLN